VTVTDSRGSWAWTITTDATTGRITSIAVDGHPELQWSYAIDGNGLLTSVSTPTGVWRTYTYTFFYSPQNARLATARDGAGHLIESHVYAESGQALTSSGDAEEITNIAYDLAGREPGEWRTHVTYASGRTTDFYSRHLAGKMRTVQIDGSCDCGSEDGVFVYDAAGHLVREQDALGSIHQRQYIADRLVAETRHLRPASCDPATDAQRCRLTPATLGTAVLIATDASRTVSFEYADPNFPDRITRTTTASVSNPSGVRQETFTYDVISGVMTSQSITGWTESPVRQETHTTATALYDGTEDAAFNPGAWFPQTWRTLPQPPKQRKSVDGPRPGVADTTKFVYYPVDPSVPATWRGRLAASRNPAGHMTRFENYDIFGNATRIVDANEVATELTYDSLGRLLTTTGKGVPGCDTGMDPLCATDITHTRVYGGNGPLTSEVRGDSVTSYTYDGRGRVLTISRGPSLGDLRERIESTYDPATGKKAEERVLAFENATWVEKKRESYAYDTSEQLSRITHPDGTSVEYTYGPGSQLLAVRDENHTAPNTAYGYDVAGRLQKVTQTLSTASAGSIQTSYGYDRDGNLTSVTDPNGNVTTYRYDDFGLMLEQLSPVTGTTRYKYDNAGQLLSTTLADGSVTTRTYDPMGRVLSATSTLNERSESVTWEYDAGTFGKGRLTSMSDPTGSTSYVHDRRGLLLAETKTIDSAVYTTMFGYDADGNRSRITYPSGRIVDYTFDFASRPVTATTGQTPLVLSASYLPFGPLRELVLGNGTTRVTTYDQRYRLLTNRLDGPLVSGEGEAGSGVVASYEYTYDPAGNITRIADRTDPAYDRDFGYDDLHRLTTANGGPGLWGAGSYSYDAMGNMHSAAVGGNVRTFTMAGRTPKIAEVLSDGRLEGVTYDAVGNETTVGAQTFEYSPRNSLRATGDRIYEYDGRGIRTTTIHTVTLAAFSLDVPTASPNQIVTGIVSLSAVAPAGGLSVRLASTSSAVTIPSEVVVAPGQASAVFTASVAADAQPGPVTLTATYATSLQATLTITESPALTSFNATPSPIVGGNPITAEVTLAAPAPEGGAVVAITAEREDVASGTITIAAGATSGTTVLETSPIPFAVTVLLTASYGGSTLETTVQLQAAIPATDRLVIIPDGVLGGENANATLHLVDAVPPGGRTFQLTSSHPAVAQVPASIHIGVDCEDGDGGGGACPDGTFAIVTSPVTAETPVTITASDGTVTLTALLTLVCPTGPTPDLPSLPARSFSSTMCSRPAQP
jgi:YD repeat-containing protein